MAPRLTDSHCHLDEFADPAAVLDEAAADGVARVVSVAQDRSSMAAALSLKERFPARVLAGLGVHPSLVTQREAAETAADLEYLAAHVSAADVVGEIGLDHKWALDAAQQQLQDQVLGQLMELASEHGKPINLHSRRCLRQVMERAIAYTRTTGLGAQLHWFAHSRKLIRLTNEAGVYVSVGPTVLGDPQTAQVCRQIADHLLLVETDAPVAVRGQAGHPRRARQVAQKLADIRGVSVEALAALTEANLGRYLGT